MISLLRFDCGDDYNRLLSQIYQILVDDDDDVGLVIMFNVDAAQHDICVPPQSLQPVYDNSIERASVAAHRDFGGPAEQR